MPITSHKIPVLPQVVFPKRLTSVIGWRSRDVRLCGFAAKADRKQAVWAGLSAQSIHRKHVTSVQFFAT